MNRLTQGDLILEIAADGMSATLTVRNTGRLINESDLIELLQESGIQHGWEQAREALTAQGLAKTFDSPFPIAIGEPYSEPRVEFSLRFPPERCIDPDQWSFDHLSGLETARTGHPLADLFITKPGKSGMNLLGEEVLAPQSDESVIQAHIGQNVYYSPERSQILASAAGYPYLDREGRVNLMCDFVIEGDLTVAQANFELFANLTVNGSIKDKIELHVGGNLTVSGDIDDAAILVDGSLKVQGDILNCRTNGVTILGDVEFGSAENARIACAQSIRFRENAHFCRLIAERGVYGSEEHSAIVGGIVQSGENVEAAVIGNASAIGTEIEITIRPFLKEKMLTLIKRLTSLRENAAGNAAEIAALTEEIQMMEHQLEEEINRTLMSGDVIPKHITAFKRIFGGAYLRILKKSQTVVDEVEKVCFSIHDGELVKESYGG
jgi:uncharacterized protein (DUF342 family)